MNPFLAAFEALLGGNPIDGINKIIEEFHASPEQKAQIQQAAAQLETQRAQIEAARDTALAEISEKDRESARGREVALKDRVVGILALAVTAGFFGLLGLAFFHIIPTANQQLLYTSAGVLGTAWIMVMTYYFGSSKGSADKTDILSNQLAQLTTNQGAQK